jgi:hypothetical protein
MHRHALKLEAANGQELSPVIVYSIKFNVCEMSSLNFISAL